MSLVAQVPVVKTGMYWLMKSLISEVHVNKIRTAYTYYNQKDDSNFYTFIETEDKIGVPNGDLYKLEQIIGQCKIDDRTATPLFASVVNSKGLVLRDYQQNAMQEIEDYLDSGGTTFNLAGNCGCVDCDTEFLTPTGWKRIADYKQGDILLQWSPDTSTEWVKPFDYIKVECDVLNRVKTASTEMIISDEHRVPYITSKGYFGCKEFGDLKSLRSIKIPKDFKTPINSTGVNMSDVEIRVLIMQSADGHMMPKSDGRIRINVKKECKKHRVIQLLESASIQYSIIKGAPGYLCVMYKAPLFTKDLTTLYGCNHLQLEVVADEAVYWGGYVSTATFSGNDTNSAVIQYAVSCTKDASNINSDTVDFYTGVSEYKTKDGFKYCFTVPSGFFLARCNGKVFPTGNSGKTFMLAALIAKMKVKVLIIAHLTSLIEQIKNEIETATGLTVTVLNSKNTEIGDINVATSQFISKNEKVWYQIKTGIGFIVVDEAETVGSLSTLRIIQRSYAKYRMFISATFSRSIDKRTGALLDVAGTKRIELVTNTTLKPTIIQVKCPEVFKAPTNKNLYQRAKGKFYSNTSIDEKVLKITQASLAKNRQVLIGIDIIDVQERLASKLNDLGIATGIMNGGTKAKDRTEILAKYDRGEVQVLLGVAVLNAGLSIPKLSTLIKLAVPSSVEKLEQLVGRTRRDFEGKDGAFVIDLVFEGFKNQLPFYRSKVKDEGWKIYQTSYDKFIQQV